MDSYKMINQGVVSEVELRPELERDEKSYLMEGHRKLELAQYLVENMHFDEMRQRLFFLKSAWEHDESSAQVTIDAHHRSLQNSTIMDE